jgi:acetyl esterase/lipase
VTVLLLMPVAAAGLVPCLYHLHGGGLVTGTAYDDVVPLAELAARTGCAIASVDYRLAPEHPYPAALDDAYSGLVWLARNAEALGVDASGIVIEGISAGGGLAAATTLLARDLGGPALAGQLLVCPMLDDRNDSASAHQMVGHGAWDRTANATAWDAYLAGALRPGRPERPRVLHGAGVVEIDPRGYAAPARATSLGRLPPTFVDVGSAETFRDEAVAYAGRMWLAGGDTELHVWPGGFHGFDYAAPHAAISQDAREARVRWLSRLLRRRVAEGTAVPPAATTP